MSQATDKQATSYAAKTKASDGPSAIEPKRPKRRRRDGIGRTSHEETAVEEAETEALVTIHRALVPLSLESKRKVLRWFVTNYSVALEPNHQAVVGKGRSFEDLAALFEAAHPSTDVERALAACYFHNQVEKDSDVDTRLLANDLRQIGHNLPNVSASMRDLNVRTPSLVMIASANRARHKRYRITSAGTKYIEEMMRRRSES